MERNSNMFVCSCSLVMQEHSSDPPCAGHGSAKWPFYKPQDLGAVSQSVGRSVGLPFFKINSAPSPLCSHNITNSARTHARARLPSKPRKSGRVESRLISRFMQFSGDSYSQCRLIERDYVEHKLASLAPVPKMTAAPPPFSH